MLVRLEPKDWLMHAVYLFFDEDKPDPEDQEVRDYLAAHGLEPKRDTTTTWDGARVVRHVLRRLLSRPAPARTLRHTGAAPPSSSPLSPLIGERCSIPLSLMG